MTCFLFILSIIISGILCLSATQNSINAYVRALLSEPFIVVLGESADRFGADYLLGIVIGANILTFAIAGEYLVAFSKQMGEAIRILASYTFSIYLYHMPILFFISAVQPYNKNPVANILLCLIATPLAILLLGNITEKKKSACKALLYSSARYLTHKK